jgi:hypothetical protein
MSDVICVDDEQLDLGPCCACGRAGADVRNVVMLPKRVPRGHEGTGWGCCICHVPMDGASVVVCDACLAAQAPYREAMLGYPKAKQRCPIEALTEPFDHNRAYHPESWVWTEEVSDACGVCGQPLPDPDADEDLEEDAQPDIPLHLWRDGGREGLRMHWSCAQACFKAGTLKMDARRETEDAA